MPIPKRHQGDYPEEDFRVIETQASKYRNIVLDIIESKLKELDFKVGDFDKDNYNLRRAFKDGGAYHLNQIKEYLKDA